MSLRLLSCLFNLFTFDIRTNVSNDVYKQTKHKKLTRNLWKKSINHQHLLRMIDYILRMKNCRYIGQYVCIDKYIFSYTQPSTSITFTTNSLTYLIFKFRNAFLHILEFFVSISSLPVLSFFKDNAHTYMHISYGGVFLSVGRSVNAVEACRQTLFSRIYTLIKFVLKIKI